MRLKAACASGEPSDKFLRGVASAPSDPRRRSLGQVSLTGGLGIKQTVSGVVMKQCKRCGGTAFSDWKRSGGIGRRVVCIACERARLATIRAARTSRPETPEQRKAHLKVQNAIKRGRLVKQPCERCGTIKNVQAHHEDYTKPLDVMWLCAKHHKERHREIRCQAV